jgi:hypothetical protein
VTRFRAQPEEEVMVEGVFYVRIFIYGLIGFVSAQDRLTVLVPHAEHHNAFVAYMGVCNSPNCVQLPDGTKVPGYPLDGDQISWSIDQNAGNGDPYGTEPRPSIVSLLPNTFNINTPVVRGDGAAFSWVTPLSRLVRSGEIDGECLAQDPAGCNPQKGGLDGRLVIDAGHVSTCRLVATKACGDPDTKARLHSFTFKPTSIQQSLAEIVLSQTAVAGTGVTLRIKKFNGTPVATVNLTPKACIGRAGSCVDIFIGNMGENVDCSVDPVRGDHFAAFYNLLKDQAQLPQGLPIPVRDNYSVKAVDYQPPCRDVPTPPEDSAAALTTAKVATRGSTAGGAAAKLTDRQAKKALKELQRRPWTQRDRKWASDLNEYLGGFFPYPNQRPICPMGDFDPPPL